MNWRKIGLWLMAIPLLVASCEKNDPDGPQPAPTSDRTVLVYIAAQNSLYQFGLSNIDDMITGMKGQTANLIVYFDGVQGPSVLYKIEGNGTKTLIETYQTENSASAEVLDRVLKRTMHLYPAGSYGLVLWSHGKGWVPSTLSLQHMQSRPQGESGPSAPLIGAERGLWERAENALMTKTFATDDGFDSEIEIPDMASVLPTDRKLDFLLMDACFMSTAETLYDLRHAAKYIIASPTEIMGTGFPYTKVVPMFFEATLDLPGICNTFVEYYRTHPIATSGSIALVATSELENLAASVRDVFALNPNPTVDVNNVQIFEKLRSHVFFDLEDYLSQVAPGTPQFAAFQQQLARTVLAKPHTDQIYSAYGGSGFFSLKKYSGISTYIPRTEFPVYNQAYRSTAWAKAIGLGQ